MSLQQKLMGRFASLESDTPAAGGVADALRVGEVVDEDGVQLDGETLPENEIIEATADAEIVDEGASETEELIETSEALESFLAAARAGKKQGGWTTQEATAYSLGINVALARIGGDSKDVMPSLESFGTSRERINSTGSVENRITDALKTIWEQIKKAVNKVVVFVKKWYLKIADGASRLKKRAEAIRKKADNTTGTAKEKKIRIGVLSTIHVNKNAPSAQELITNIKAVGSLLGELTQSQMESGFQTTIENLATAIDGVVNNSDGNDVGGVISAVKQIFSKAEVSNLEAVQGGVEAKYAQLNGMGAKLEKVKGITLGNKEITTITFDGNVGNDEEGAEKAARVAGFAFKFHQDDVGGKKVEVDESKEAPVLSAADASQIASGVMEFCDVVIDYKKNFENYDRATKSIFTKVDKIAAKDVKGDDDGANRAKIVRSTANAVGSALKNRGQGITTITNYGLGICRAALVYANSSLNQYRGD